MAGKDLEREQYPKNYEQWFRLEANAVSLRTFDTHIINGLLQTEEYARAVFEAAVPRYTHQRLEELLEERLSRQRLLSREPVAILCFILSEALLRHATGGHKVLREQLEHLLDVGKLNHVQVLVLPFDSEEPVGAAGPMTLLETPERRMLGYSEVQGKSALVSDAEVVSAWAQRFGMIQVHALRPPESTNLIQRRLEEL